MLILIHGALGSAAQLRPLRAALDSSLDVSVVELEGHGETMAPGPFALERFTDNVADAVRASGADRAHLFGYSMGGYVALHLAATQPGLVASITTLGTKLDWSPEVAAREIRQLDAATIRAKVPRFAAVLEERHAGAGGWERVLARTAALIESTGARPAITDDVLAAIEAPVRLMVGDRDAVVTVEETVAARARLKHGDVCVLPSTAHPLEQVRLPLLAALIHDSIAARRA